MTLGDLEHDPVTRAPTQNINETQLRNVAAYVLLGGLAVQVASWLVAGPVIGRLLAQRSVATANPEANAVYWELSANLTALLALIAAVSSIYFTYRQLQAKVKADSRQAWIDKLRDRIARFIALANSDKNHRCDSDPYEFDHRRLEMELMLNPSEKDHRLLMYLSLRLAFYRSGDEAFQKVHDVINITAAIKQSSGYNKEKWKELLGPIPPLKPKAAFKKPHSDLVGYTLRLAHVVLKREWERVKTTR